MLAGASSFPPALPSGAVTLPPLAVSSRAAPPPGPSEGRHRNRSAPTGAASRRSCPGLHPLTAPPRRGETQSTPGADLAAAARGPSGGPAPARPARRRWPLPRAVPRAGRQRRGTRRRASAAAARRRR